MRKLSLVVSFHPVKGWKNHPNKKTKTPSHKPGIGAWDLPNFRRLLHFSSCIIKKSTRSLSSSLEAITNRQVGDCSHQRECWVIAEMYLIFLLVRQHIKNRPCSTSEGNSIHLEPGSKWTSHVTPSQTSNRNLHFFRQAFVRMTKQLPI